MKKNILLLLIGILVACSNKNDIKKPAKPIDKVVMESILYDLALLQAIKSYSPEKLTQNNINTKTYIYQKYKIDSLQFAENNRYFASNTEQYNLMFERISKKLESKKAKIDNSNNQEMKKNRNRIKDSITKAAKIAKSQNKPVILAKG